MKKEMAQAWVKALRSGEYEQCFGYLYSDGKYCCLGVLNDLNGNKEVSPNDLSTTYKDLGLNDALGKLSHSFKTLSYLNDIQDFNFDEIADIIQAEYLLDIDFKPVEDDEVMDSIKYNSQYSNFCVQNDYYVPNEKDGIMSMKHEDLNSDDKNDKNTKLESNFFYISRLATFLLFWFIALAAIVAVIGDL